MEAAREGDLLAHVEALAAGDGIGAEGHLHPRRREGLHDVPPHEAGAAENQDVHGVTLPKKTAPPRGQGGEAPVGPEGSYFFFVR